MNKTEKKVNRKKNDEVVQWEFTKYEIFDILSKKNKSDQIEYENIQKNIYLI